MQEFDFYINLKKPTLGLYVRKDRTSLSVVPIRESTRLLAGGRD
jgi:hypothetical protein